MKWNVAVVGATGMVGREMLTILENKHTLVDSLLPVASVKSAGKKISWRGRQLKIHDCAKFDFSSVDVVLFSAGGAVSEVYVPKALQAGALVIDNTSTFRYDNDVPLVVPEVNSHVLPDTITGQLIANPNCSTIALVLALSPLHKAFGVNHVDVATYQAVSGAGQIASTALTNQTQAKLTDADCPNNPFDAPIAFNCIPHIDVPLENGYSKEEMKMHWETQKLLQDSNVCVSATCVRVPVYVGHGQAVHLEFKDAVDRKMIEDVLNSAPGVRLCSEHWQPTSRMIEGIDEILIGRLRSHHMYPHKFAFWLVGDNVRKGAALNSVQILEAMHKKSGQL